MELANASRQSTPHPKELCQTQLKHCSRLYASPYSQVDSKVGYLIIIIIIIVVVARFSTEFSIRSPPRIACWQQPNRSDLFSEIPLVSTGFADSVLYNNNVQKSGNLIILVRSAIKCSWCLKIVWYSEFNFFSVEITTTIPHFKRWNHYYDTSFMDYSVEITTTIPYSIRKELKMQQSGKLVVQFLSWEAWKRCIFGFFS